METCIELNHIGNCFICFEDVPNGFEMTCCHHYLHTTCLLQWITYHFLITKDQSSHPSCPMCRSDIKLCDIFTLEDVLTHIKDNNNTTPISHEQQRIIENYLSNEYNTKVCTDIICPQSLATQPTKIQKYKTYMCSVLSGLGLLFLFLFVTGLLYNRK
jgi:hypothetical protein